MKINGQQRATLGATPKIQQRRESGQTHQQNKQHLDRSLPPQQLIDQISAMTHTDQHTHSRKYIMKHMRQQTTSGNVWQRLATSGNVWIGTSHVFLPTWCCSKCDSWSSYHDERTRWQAMKNAQLAKQEE
jgi:hypothetical protein